MTAKILELADALVGELNGHSFGIPFVAERGYLPTFELTELDSLDRHLAELERTDRGELGTKQCRVDVDRHGALASGDIIRWRLANRGELDEATPMELEHEAAAHHVAESAVGLAPVPRLAEELRERAPAGAAATVYKQARQRALNAFERSYVLELLKAHDGNVTSAAQAAGITRNYLHKMMKRHGVVRRVVATRDAS